MHKVIVQGEDGVKTEFPLRGLAKIGRDSECEIRLKSKQISRVHTTLEVSSTGVVVTDQGSMNGTMLDGKPLKANVPTTFRSGQILLVGEFSIQLDFEEEDLTYIVPNAEDAVDPAEQFVCSHLIESEGEIPVWDGTETEFVVTAVIAETHDVNTFRFVGQTPMRFSYLPGQFVGVSVEIDGKRVRRSYSISSSPSRPHVLEITVKRLPGGLVSNWLADHIVPGSRLSLKGPMGKFSCIRHPGPKALMIAAGSGVTPIMSMTRWIVDSGAPLDVIILYSVRSPADMVFGRELESMAARYPNITVFVTATDISRGTHGWTGLNRRLNGAAISLVAPDFLERQVFLCGPKPFADAIFRDLSELGVSREQIHQESFGGKPRSQSTKPEALPPVAQSTRIDRSTSEPASSASSNPVAETPKPVLDKLPASRVPAAEPTPGTAFKIQFIGSGIACEWDGESTLLETSENNDVDIDSGCREGTCGTCQTRCKSGEVSMPEDACLDKSELEEGWILPCVAKPTTHVELDA